MAIVLRGTFLDACGPEVDRPLRSSSAPPAQGGRSAGADPFLAERLYADTLVSRAAQLRRELPCKEDLLSKAAVRTASEAGSGKDAAFGTASTTATWASQVSSDSESDADEGADEKAFLQDVRAMAEGLLQGMGVKEAMQGARHGASNSSDHKAKAPWSEAVAEVGEKAEVITTMMLYDLPCRVLQEQLAEAMEAEGFAGRYDWLFVPKSRARGSNPGYAFVNFVSAAEAERCVQVFTGYRFAGTTSNKVCAVKPARLQGREANLAQFGGGRRRKAGNGGR